MRTEVSQVNICCGGRVKMSNTITGSACCVRRSHEPVNVQIVTRQAVEVTDTANGTQNIRAVIVKNLRNVGSVTGTARGTVQNRSGRLSVLFEGRVTLRAAFVARSVHV